MINAPHGFGKEICLIARDLNPARKSRGARLESSNGRMVIELMRKINKLGKTVIIITHDM